MGLQGSSKSLGSRFLSPGLHVLFSSSLFSDLPFFFDSMPNGFHKVAGHRTSRLMPPVSRQIVSTYFSHHWFIFSLYLSYPQNIYIFNRPLNWKKSNFFDLRMFPYFPTIPLIFPAPSLPTDPRVGAMSLSILPMNSVIATWRPCATCWSGSHPTNKSQGSRAWNYFTMVKKMLIAPWALC